MFDGRKRPVRGLWVCSGCFYARVALEAATTVAEAQAALRRLRTHQEDPTLPVRHQTPKFRDHVADYFAHYAKATKEKRTSTLATERAHLRRS